LFKKIRIRLTVLNAFIFFSVLAIFSMIIYGFCYVTLYRDVNQSIDKAIVDFEADISLFLEGIKMQEDPIDLEGLPVAEDPRVSIFFWTDQGEMVSSYIIDRKYEADFKPILSDQFEKMKVGGHTYQTKTIDVVGGIVLPVHSAYGYERVLSTKVQFVSNTRTQQELLDRLLLIIIIGDIIGILVVIAVGFFLSKRALVPINQSWEKQQQFVSDASHELRTPLSVIQMRADSLLRHPEATIQDQVSDVSAISSETRRLSKLVTNLLTLARSDSNQMEVIKQTFSLTELLQEVVDQFVDIAEFQGKQLILNVNSGLQFYGDKEKIHQLLVILLDNALKFTDQGGCIELICHESTSSIHLQVKDDGAGIKAADVDKVFDRFYQGDKSRTRQEGSGLGLSIAKWIVKRHHGKIAVDSSESGGTTFFIAFPKVKKSGENALNLRFS